MFKGVSDQKEVIKTVIQTIPLQEVAERRQTNFKSQLYVSSMHLGARGYVWWV